MGSGAVNQRRTLDQVPQLQEAQGKATDFWR